jgi:hypothetical protein
MYKDKVFQCLAEVLLKQMLYQYQLQEQLDLNYIRINT